MKTTTNTNLLKTFSLFLILTLGISSCSSNNSSDDDSAARVCDQLVSMSTDFSNTLNAFQSSPSTETCNSLRNSALNFIDAVQDCQQFAEQYGSLEEAAQQWLELDCSEGF